MPIIAGNHSLLLEKPGLTTSTAPRNAAATPSACAGLIFSPRKKNEQMIAKNGESLLRMVASARSIRSMV